MLFDSVGIKHEVDLPNQPQQFTYIPASRLQETRKMQYRKERGYDCGQIKNPLNWSSYC